MSMKRDFVAEFTPVIVDQTQAPQTVKWAKDRFANGFTLTFDDMKWSPKLTWEQDGAMSCGIHFYDENGNPLQGLEVSVGWSGLPEPIQARTNGDGWIDVPISGGNYSQGSSGPMYIRLNDGSLSYEGIGWRNGTNHSHLNFDVKRGKFSGTVPPVVVPPVTPEPPLPPTGSDLAALQAYVKAEVARQLAAMIDRIKAAL